MHFALRQQGPAQVCGTTCKTYVVASGAITADTPAEFRNFAKNLNLKGALVVLESEGGSVHGAMALGRDIRKLGLDTTIGHVTDLKPAPGEAPRGIYDPHADCESMCSFVLLAGIQRSVPPEARVMVHQIWLGDRREDPTAASYSAEDLVLVQRDIGKLAIYTAEMGGSMDMLDLALRIPPWEPMHTMTRAEIERMGVETSPLSAKATVATAQPATAQAQPIKLMNAPAAFAEVSGVLPRAHAHTLNCRRNRRPQGWARRLLPYGPCPKPFSQVRVRGSWSPRWDSPVVMLTVAPMRFGWRPTTPQPRSMFIRTPSTKGARCIW